MNSSNIIRFVICALSNPLLIVLYFFFSNPIVRLIFYTGCEMFINIGFIKQFASNQVLALSKYDMSSNVAPAVQNVNFLMLISLCLIGYYIFLKMEFYLLKKFKGLNWDLFLKKKFSTFYWLPHLLFLVLVLFPFYLSLHQINLMIESGNPDADSNLAIAFFIALFFLGAALLISVILEFIQFIILWRQKPIAEDELRAVTEIKPENLS